MNAGKIFVGALSAETNMFSPVPTDIGSFRDHLWVEAGALGDAAIWPAPLEGFRLAAQAHGWHVAQGLCVAAEPAAPMSAADYAEVRDRLLDDLRAALPVDAVALSLHGGMIAAGVPDCEGDILQRVRAIVGLDVPVGAVLDPHAHLTDAMVKSADLLIFFREYPHTDIEDRAQRLVERLIECRAGAIRPVASVFDCRMIDFYFTDREPMRAFVDDMTAAEEGPILSVSLVHGFPWGDVPEMGTKMLVYTDGNAPLGQEVAERFGRRLFALRGTTLPPLLSVPEAAALAEGWQGALLVLADAADNPGGGAPGDATWLIGALIDAGIEGVLAGLVWDPMLVRQAAALGPGGEARFRIGGKASPWSGPPLDVDARVLSVVRDAVQHADGWDWPMGDAVLLEIGGVRLAVCDRRVQCVDPAVFRMLGAMPEAARVIVVKSAQHFVAGFEAIAGRIAYVESPGVLSLTGDAARYRHLSRPKWPFDPDPFADGAGVITTSPGRDDHQQRGKVDVQQG